LIALPSGVRVRICAVALLSGDDGVERSTTGAPTAFRIWKAGDNPTDHGVHKFTARSARTLAAEQAARGNLYSIDVDHLSLTKGDKAAVPEARKAVGFHQLEVREGAGGPELWATNVEWTDAVRAGLEKKPPEWRYFSPAYDVDKRTGEIVSYLNTALTNNPATWNVTALASLTEGVRTMDYKEIAAALFGDDDEKKKDARKCIAGMTDLEKKAYKAAVKAAFAEDEGDSPEKKPDGEKKDETRASEGEKPKEETKASEDKPEEKEKAAIAATRELASTVAEQQKELEALKADRLERDRAAILATRPDLPPTLVKTLRTMPIELMKATIDGVPKPPAPDPAAASRVTAIRGESHQDGDGYGSVRAARLPPEERRELASRFGHDTSVRRVHWDPAHPNDLVFPLFTPGEARAILASRAAEQQAARKSGAGASGNGGGK